MRLNKKKLAALAMSAVMAASTMPFPVMAEEFTSETAEVGTFADGGQTSDGYQVDPSTIVFHYGDGKDFQVDYTEVSVNDPTKTYDATATASVLKQTEAKCKVPAYLWMTVTIDGKVYNSGNPDDENTAFVTAPALEHKYDEIKRQTLVAPTHKDVDGHHTGLAHVWYKCSLCGDKYDAEVTLDEQDHTWGEVQYMAGTNVKADAKGHVVFDADKEPVLIDETKDGLYYEKYFCTKDGVEDTSRTVEKRVYAKKAEYAVITSKKDIATDLVGMKFLQPTKDLPLAIEDIELDDCSKAGSYVVTYYNVEDKPISSETITVAPHHYKPFKTAVFKTKDDMNQVEVERNADGSLKVTNKSCYLPITYTEVTHCTAAGCKEKDCEAEYEKLEKCDKAYTVIKTEEKTAQPAGDHIIKTTAKDEIKAKVARGNVLYSELKAIADIKTNFVKISARPENNCEKGGKVTVSFLCVVDKETVVEQMEVDVIPTGHTRAVPVRENYVAPTCTALGSYDAVVKCETCGKELERRVGVKIPRLTHTNESVELVDGLRTYVPDTTTDTNAYIKFIGNKVVDHDGELLSQVGVTFGNRVGHEKAEFSVRAEVDTNCSVCHDHELTLDSSNTVKLTVVDIKKQKETGEAGYITLKASYTKANGETISETYSKIPYFSTMESYQGRTENIPLNGLHKDSDGVYRYYVDNVFAKDFSGIVEYYGEKFFVANGVLASDADGLNLNVEDGKWYYLYKGQIQRAHTGLAKYKDEWFYIVNGKLDTTVNGLVPYDGGKFVFAEGRLCKEANGLWQDSDGTWYFLSQGQVQTQFTGVAMYDGQFFVVKGGKLASDYNGTIEYDGAKFKVVAGQLYDKIA